MAKTSMIEREKRRARKVKKYAAKRAALKEQARDPKASPENPIWQMVDIRLEEIFPRTLPLDELHGIKSLRGMELLRRGSRLSVQPVSATEWSQICKMGGVSA